MNIASSSMQHAYHAYSHPLHESGIEAKSLGNVALPLIGSAPPPPPNEGPQAFRTLKPEPFHLAFPGLKEVSCLKGPWPSNRKRLGHSGLKGLE